MRAPGSWHAEARRLRSLGWTYQAIADELDVSTGSLSPILSPNGTTAKCAAGRRYRQRHPERNRQSCRAYKQRLREGAAA
jgi:orotate phosphoribosyltransferase-like protein